MKNLWEKLLLYQKQKRSKKAKNVIRGQIAEMNIMVIMIIFERSPRTTNGKLADPATSKSAIVNTPVYWFIINK